MLNALKKVSPKEWLYIGGAVASLAAIAWIAGQQVHPGPGVHTDAPDNAALPLAPSPGYTSYNVQPITPVPLANASPDSTPAGAGGCGCPTAYGCAGPSQLDTGNAYTDTGQLLDFFKQTNPNYANLYATQLGVYDEYFAAGQMYNDGAGTIAGMVGHA